MPQKVFSAAPFGLNCELVEVEVDLLGALNPSFNIVGLGDTSIQESKERIRSAFKNSGLEFPRKRKVVNLAPADLRKHGPLYDLPIAVGLLATLPNFPSERLSAFLEETLFIGELALDGRLKPVNGVLSIAAFAKKSNFSAIVVPEINAAEADLIPDLEVLPVANFYQLIEHITGEKLILPFHNSSPKPPPFNNFQDNLTLIKGQAHAKRALEISAAGGHNLLFSGPPGSGKTLLARSITDILPELSFEEALETTSIYSFAGLIDREIPLLRERPFRAVHHSASGAAIVGGGRIPRPGEISLAHKGILFLDECAEFPGSVLDYLRQPLEDRKVTIARANGSVTFPAHFILIAAMNPCPCGFYTDPQRPCHCSAVQIQRYQKKISGPLLDRIDLHIEVPRLSFQELNQNPASDIILIKKRVNEARNLQKNRFHNLKITLNSEMGPADIAKFCHLNKENLTLMESAVSRLHLSPRAYHRIIKVARTIADLENSPEISPHHITEALQYRQRLNSESIV